MAETREMREKLVSVLVVYCDRCGNECPALDDNGHKSGFYTASCGHIHMIRVVEGGRGVWAFGSDDYSPARRGNDGYEDSEKVLCVPCLEALGEWLTGGRAAK